MLKIAVCLTVMLPPLALASSVEAFCVRYGFLVGVHVMVLPISPASVYHVFPPREFLWGISEGYVMPCAVVPLTVQGVLVPDNVNVDAF